MVRNWSKDLDVYVDLWLKSVTILYMYVGPIDIVHTLGVTFVFSGHLSARVFFRLT